MEVINKDLGLEFYVLEYEFPISWAVNTIGKNADWLMMKFNYIDKNGMREFEKSALLSQELTEIKDAFSKVSQGEISGYNGRFVDKSFTISFSEMLGDIVTSVTFIEGDEIFTVTENMGPDRVEEFLSELEDMVEEFPIRGNIKP